MPSPEKYQSILLQQQSALARFGEFALSSEDLKAVLQNACLRVSEGLHTDLAKVVELQPDGQTLLVRAGVGWRPGTVGMATSVATDNTFEGEALRTQEPVACSELTEDNLDKVAPFVRDHGVVSFVNVNILGAGSAPSYGILEVDCLRRREFNADDIDFLRTYANLLGVVIQRLKAHAELRLRAEENERLLRELQHRTKNNLQILTSLVNFQARRSEEAPAREALRKVGQRINALSLVHEKLFQSGQTETIDLGAYVCDIARSLLRMHEEGDFAIRLASETEAIEVPPALAITLGLVTNEFVTNSLKHAFGKGAGTIGIDLVRTDSHLIALQLWDDGRGLPQSASRGSGMSLIEALARPVASEIEWTSNPGTRLRLVVKPL